MFSLNTYKRAILRGLGPLLGGTVATAFPGPPRFHGLIFLVNFLSIFHGVHQLVVLIGAALLFVDFAHEFGPIVHFGIYNMATGKIEI
jgi:hypothetical protein